MRNQGVVNTTQTNIYRFISVISLNDRLNTCQEQVYFNETESKWQCMMASHI